MEEQEGTCDKSRGPKRKERDRLVHQNWTARIRGVRSTQLEQSSLPDAKDSFLFLFPRGVSNREFETKETVYPDPVFPPTFLSEYYQAFKKVERIVHWMLMFPTSVFLSANFITYLSIPLSLLLFYNPFYSLMCFEVNCQETLAHSGSQTVDWLQGHTKGKIFSLRSQPQVSQILPKRLCTSLVALPPMPFTFALSTSDVSRGPGEGVKQPWCKTGEWWELRTWRAPAP